jgi:quinol-cytochrome oxidoreductase complex cytochrome b subunit
MPENDLTADRLNLLQRIQGSIFPGPPSTSLRPAGYRRLFNSLFFHFRPRSVPEPTLRISLTWGLGGMAVVLVCLLFATGLLLKFTYQPTPDRAYDSLMHLQNNVLFGQLIRNIHYWSGNILLIVAFLHFLRVYFTGAFHPPRQFNWIIGLALLLSALLSNITGYLLPWDQLSFWAITICTGMLEYLPVFGHWLQQWVRGGSEIGAGTLSIFFAIHTALIPACILFLLFFHVWRIRKAGGLVIPRRPDDTQGGQPGKVPAMPNLFLRELVVALVLMAIIMAVSVIFDAPLGEKANPGLSPNPTKAPWYVAGIQELLQHFHPLFAIFILPALAFSALISIPYLNYPSQTSGVWFASKRGRRLALAGAVMAFVVVPAYLIADELLIPHDGWFSALPPIVSDGILPTAPVLASIGAFYWLLRKRYHATANEALQSVFVLITTGFLIMTITCIWFRGPGMALMWP